MNDTANGGNKIEHTDIYHDPDIIKKGMTIPDLERIPETPSQADQPENSPSDNND